MTENTGRPYEIRGMSRSMVQNMIQITIRITGRTVELKSEPGNPGAGRSC